MKTFNLKKLSLAAAVLLLFATIASCNDEGEKVPNENTSDTIAILGTYTGGEYANAKYFQHLLPRKDAKIIITQENDEFKTTTIIYISSTWGIFTFNNVSVNKENDYYTFSGEGTVEMPNMPQLPGMPSMPNQQNGNEEETHLYSATISGTVKNNHVEAIFYVPIMGGTEILFNPNDFEKVLNIQNAEEIIGTYTGGEYANTKYFQKYLPTDGIEANISIEDSIVILTYKSPTWGTFIFSNVSIDKEDDVYTISGEGTVDMPNDRTGEIKTYNAIATGTIANGRLVATFTAPDVMGGTDILFNPNDFEIVLNEDLIGNYIGSEYANSAMFNKYRPTTGVEANITYDNNLIRLHYNSPTWGVFTYNNVYIIKENDSYFISGEGSVDMPNEHTGVTTTYDATVTGTIKNGILAVTFSVPSVMGGLEILFTSHGEMSTIKYDFENVRMVETSSKTYYYEWYEVDDEGNDIAMWASGNGGFYLSKTKAEPDEYPTISVEGYEGKGVKLETRDTGSFGAMFKMPLAAGNLFVGEFVSESALQKPLEATRFGKLYASDRKPIKFTGYYKYKPGDKFQDKNRNTIADKVDEGAIYAILYKNHDAEGNEIVLHGDDVQTNEHIVARAIMSKVEPVEEWTKFEIEFVYDGIEFDWETLKTLGYNLTIVFSSSKDGAYFEGAIGSTLYIDNVEILCETK